MRAKDLTGQQFGRLAVIRATNKRGGGHIIHLCLCDCGKLTEVRGNDLQGGKTQSCNCYQKERVTKHAEIHTRMYRTWQNMKSRTRNQNCKDYRWYGKRGIKVCDEWLNDYVVFRSWALTNGYTLELTIDRIDNDGNYNPDNCQFITRSENVKKAFQKI